MEQRQGDVTAVRAGVDGTVELDLRKFDGRDAVFARTASDRRRGALARRDGESLTVAARTALQLRIPLVLVLASSGADVSEGIDSLHGWGGAARGHGRLLGDGPGDRGGDRSGRLGPGPAARHRRPGRHDPAAVAFVSGPAMVEDFTGVRVAWTLGGRPCTRARAGCAPWSRTTPMTQSPTC